VDGNAPKEVRIKAATQIIQSFIAEMSYSYLRMLATQGVLAYINPFGMDDEEKLENEKKIVNLFTPEGASLMAANTGLQFVAGKYAAPFNILLNAGWGLGQQAGIIERNKANKKIAKGLGIDPSGNMQSINLKDIGPVGSLAIEGMQGLDAIAKLIEQGSNPDKERSKEITKYANALIASIVINYVFPLPPLSSIEPFALQKYKNAKMPALIEHRQLVAAVREVSEKLARPGLSNAERAALTKELHTHIEALKNIQLLESMRIEKEAKWKKKQQEWMRSRNAN
jgi:hypothetical protein